MAPSNPAKTEKKLASDTGAPAQHGQTSRKGKKAWRKNVDIRPVEQALEETRAEERLTGSAMHKKADDELFFVDNKPDTQIQHRVKSTKPLQQTTAARIIAERSAVPAVVSRTTATTKRKSTLSHEERDKLLRIAKKPRKGPLNTYMDPSEFGAGSAIMGLTEAVRRSGGYDPWAASAEPETPIDELPMGLEHVQKKTIKPPTHPKVRDQVESAAVLDPHVGTSYNPPVNAHQDLLLKAHAREEKRVQDAAKLALVKNRMDQARANQVDSNSGVFGMKLDTPKDGDEEEGNEGNAEGTETHTRPQPARKTKQQRKKAAKQLAERRLLANKAANKRMLVAIAQAKSLRKELHRTSSQQVEERERLKKEISEKLKGGLAGHKLGKHKIPEYEVDVQLGEDLSESLRAMKPEGNIFRDRFISLQQRGRLEPRTLVMPMKKKLRHVEYEKHAYKRFDRD
ncbi:P60-like protein [Cylindrobasidium torrendii FP15055 ss-10]|uniref:Ribosome biogenesis protein NOP53 n=1 Tax=Cylindrobasidium torrendii FP15055 ss-10 TaxID=1314674 RepID=A0A0D7BPT8_9AGAR|nr:P60-like protein [Cylindrobasidium torrendii FP15055 ss-10]